MKVTKSTIVRTILIAFVVLNRILEATGHPIYTVDAATVEGAVNAAVEIGVIVTGFWYNNSYSKKAKQADAFMRKLKEDK